MANEGLGRGSLRLDAAYCAAAGAIALTACRPIGRMLGVRPSVVAATGVATGAWAAAVARGAGTDRWRSAVHGVAVANTVASTALMVVGRRHQRRGARLLLTAVGVDVAAFAGSQLVAA